MSNCNFYLLWNIFASILRNCLPPSMSLNSSNFCPYHFSVALTLSLTVVVSLFLLWNNPNQVLVKYSVCSEHSLDVENLITQGVSVPHNPRKENNESIALTQLSLQFSLYCFFFIVHYHVLLSCPFTCIYLCLIFINIYFPSYNSHNFLL